MKSKVVDGVKVYTNFKLLLLPGYRAIMLFGKIFYKRDMNDLDKYLNTSRGKTFINHEKIHIELANTFNWKYMSFYPKYLGYWVKNLFKYGFKKKAYYNIPFEREAYLNEKNLDYLKTGVHWKDYTY